MKLKGSPSCGCVCLGGLGGAREVPLPEEQGRAPWFSVGLGGFVGGGARDAELSVVV